MIGRKQTNKKIIKNTLSLLACGLLMQCTGNPDDLDYNPPRRYRQQTPQRYPQYQAPYAPVPYSTPRNQYQPPNSRAYRNPYDFRQPAYGNSSPYQDYEQHYVPPVQYYNNEGSGGSSGISGKS